MMFAFIHIQKSAGQTMRAILRKNFGHRHCDALVNEGVRDDDWEWIQKCYPNLVSIAGHPIQPHTRFKDYFPNCRYYTTVREPIARSLSHFQYSCIKGGNEAPFSAWMPNYSNLMCRIICGEENAQHAIDFIEEHKVFVGRMESFNESLLLWREWSNLEWLDLTYSSTNTSKSQRIKQEVLQEPANEELLMKSNLEDRKLYEYVCSDIYPRQCESYGEQLKTDLEAFEIQLSHNSSNYSWKSFCGKVKRNLVYRPGVRDWEADLEDTPLKAA